MARNKKTRARGIAIFLLLAALLVVIIIIRAKSTVIPDETVEPAGNAAIGTVVVPATQPEQTDTFVIPKTEDVVEAIVIESEIPERTVNSRYSAIAMSEEERELMAKVIYLEARGESASGQQAVAEVILNRVLHDGFPNTIAGVLWESGQFSVMPYIEQGIAGQAQYDAIDGALYGELILDEDVVFFSCAPENDRVWGWIGEHCFCREYIWE